MRKAIIFLLVIMSVTVAKAGDCLTFKTSDRQTHSVEIGDGLTLTVNGTTLTVGSTNFTLTDLEKMFFTESVSVGEMGWATYSSSKNLDYTAVSGLTVYSAQFDDNAGTVSLTELSEAVPGGEGVIVKGVNGDYYVPMATAANTLSDNGLTGTCSTEITAEGTNYYALAAVDNGVAFCQVSSGITIPANKAYYITNSGNQARYMITTETTAINNVQMSVHDSNTTEIYDLNGRKVQKEQLRKGVYVIKTKSGNHKIAVK